MKISTDLRMPRMKSPRSARTGSSVVTGAVSDPTATFFVYGIQQQSSGSFRAVVSLVEGNNRLLAVAKIPSGLAGTTSVRSKQRIDGALYPRATGKATMGVLVNRNV